MEFGKLFGSFLRNCVAKGELVQGQVGALLMNASGKELDKGKRALIFGFFF
jgi:hypothetical protein